jgi:hypothetical protein
MESWIKVCSKKIETQLKNENKITLVKNKEPIQRLLFQNKKLATVSFGKSVTFEKWFEFYNKEINYLYNKILNYISEREYETVNTDENFIRFSKLIYLKSSKLLK